MPSGDYRLIYDRSTPSRRPVEMEAYNNPILSPVNKETQYSAFLQDNWAIGRLTVNMGLRLDQYHAFVGRAGEGAGDVRHQRHVPLRRRARRGGRSSPRVGMALGRHQRCQDRAEGHLRLFTHVMTEDFAAELQPERAHDVSLSLVRSRRQQRLHAGEVNLDAQRAPIHQRHRRDQQHSQSRICSSP